MKNRNFSFFFNTKISEISESENFGTQGLHLMYLRPLGGGELELFFSSNLVSHLDKAWSKLSKDSFRMVLRQLVEEL